MIPEGMVIDHINDDKHDNRLCNLQLMTTQQNNKKSVKNHDYSFINHIKRNPKPVLAINYTTNVNIYFRSISATAKYLQITAGTVKFVSDKCYGRKTAKSKKDGCSYRFEYVRKKCSLGDVMELLNERIKTGRSQKDGIKEFSIGDVIKLLNERIKKQSDEIEIRYQMLVDDKRLSC